MRKIILILIGILSLVFVGAIASGVFAFHRINLYLIDPKQNGERTAFDLVETLRSQGFSANVGRATDDSGQTLRVVEASNTRVRIWAQNLPLSGFEDPHICGSNGARVDQGQYVVTIESKWPLMAIAARDMSEKLSNKLRHLGYEVQSQPLPCSKAFKP